MQGRISRIGVTIVFIGLLAGPLVYKRVTTRKAAAHAIANASTALARYGFTLQESAKASGIDFKHTAPTLDAKLKHIMEQVASMGAAVSIVDFDRDGWQDIYATNSSENSNNRLYRNLIVEYRANYEFHHGNDGGKLYGYTNDQRMHQCRRKRNSGAFDFNRRGTCGGCYK